MINKNNIQAFIYNIYRSVCAFFPRGFSNAATFRVWLMVKRDLSVDGIGLFSISDDPFDIELAIADYYLRQAEKYDLSPISNVNWEEIARLAIEWNELDCAAQDAGC